MEILFKRYKNFVIDVFESSKKSFMDTSNLYEMEVDPNDIGEIGPEELKQLIAETKEQLKKEVEKDLATAKEKLGGKVFNFLDIASFPKEDMDLVRVVSMFSGKYLEVISSLDNHELYHDLEAYKKFYDDAKNWKPKENRIYTRTPYISIDTDCDYDEAYIEEVRYVSPYIEIRMPDEKWLDKVATLDVLFRKVNPAVRFNCEAVKDYIAGDLTFKGFIKKISLANELSC